MMPISHHHHNGFGNGGLYASELNFHQDFGETHNEPRFLDQNIRMQQQQRQAFSTTPTMQQNSGMSWQQAGLVGNAQTPQNAQMSSPNLQAQQGVMNPMMWANQMPQTQQMQNPMMQMAPFNMISQQIMQEAFAMAQPVDSSDDPTLLTALLNAKRSRRNFKEALNGLHGTNGHSASLWKDYYLEHKDRIDDWIEKCIMKEQGKVAGPSNLQYAPYANGAVAYARNGAGEIRKPATIKKPSPSTFKREPSPQLRKPGPSRLSTATPPVKPAAKKKAKTSSQNKVQPITSGRRSTMNSLSVDAPVFDSRLPAPNASIKVPPPPSRSPSPPANIVTSARGNKFTPEDREYFIKFLGWTLQKDPDLTRMDLCALLAEKAPHHTAQSWQSFWSNNHDLPDKILASARGEISEDSEQEVMPAKKRGPVYKDLDTTDDERVSRSTEEDEESDDEDDNEEIQKYSPSQMSGSGSYNEADFYIAAKHIASANWDGVTSRQQWEEFQNMYPGRSYKSWAEYYRRNKKGLDKLVARIKKAEKESVPMQRARPSKLPSFRKRKYEDEETEAESIKRGKVGESD